MVYEIAADDVERAKMNPETTIIPSWLLGVSAMLLDPMNRQAVTLNPTLESFFHDHPSSTSDCPCPSIDLSKLILDQIKTIVANSHDPTVKALIKRADALMRCRFELSDIKFADKDGDKRPLTLLGLQILSQILKCQFLVVRADEDGTFEPPVNYDPVTRIPLKFPQQPRIFSLTMYRVFPTLDKKPEERLSCFVLISDTFTNSFFACGTYVVVLICSLFSLSFIIVLDVIVNFECPTNTNLCIRLLDLPNRDPTDMNDDNGNGQGLTFFFRNSHLFLRLLTHL
jgi:hypothetical protein